MNADFDRATQREADPMVFRDQPHSTNLQQQEWTPPQTGFVKVNCDAAWKQGSRDGGTWVIIRDSRESFMGEMFKRLQWVSSSLIAEAQALQDGQHFAWHLRVRRSDHRGYSSLDNYKEVKFQYVKRSINNAAHVVAQWDHRGVLEAERLSTPLVWLLSAL
ncbi:hypothetical protein LIER_21309 [Lithospermum erythrorhizon]|uniref:RNase H type-1 domain-containing protein n=1 Tax=Lithospermum erythrorhizon TaxID=34254 RepID=A0AAV3QVI4_LITER